MVFAAFEGNKSRYLQDVQMVIPGCVSYSLYFAIFSLLIELIFELRVTIIQYNCSCF